MPVNIPPFDRSSDLWFCTQCGEVVHSVDAIFLPSVIEGVRFTAVLCSDVCRAAYVTDFYSDQIGGC